MRVARVNQNSKVVPKNQNNELKDAKKSLLRTQRSQVLILYGSVMRHLSHMSSHVIHC